eukprot:m.53576 g.53576  ORF g.53576 m.53576 type:complete len:436 (+) comp10873_c0_seq1:86-1393(+)
MNKMMRLAVIFIALGLAAAQLTPEEQARLDELVKQNDELAQLLEKAGTSTPKLKELMDLDAKSQATLRTEKDNIVTRVKATADIRSERLERQTVSLFDVNDRVESLEKTVDPNALSSSIKDAMETAFAENTVLLGISAEQTALSKTLDTDVKAIKADTDMLTSDLNALKTSVAKDIKDISDDLEEFKDTMTKKFEADTAKIKKDTEDLIKKLLPDSTKNVLASLSNTYLGDPKIPVYRVAWFQTYNNGPVGWFDQNRNRGFGGVSPHDWTDGNARADRLGNDFKYLQSLFTRKQTASKYGAQVCAENFMMYSSTTGRMCGALFRIKNTKNVAITWSVKWVFTAYSGWSERASVALNRQNIYESGCSGHCETTVQVQVPASKTSTVIFMAGSSGNGWGWNNIHLRANINMIVDDSLALPDGLEYVDDLDTAAGNWS